MAKLRNEVSLSHSGMNTLASCARAYWWKRYGAWNGWSDSASPTTRTAYQLSKMTSLWGAIGSAIEQTCMWAVDETRAGRAPNLGAAQVRALGQLRGQWRESASNGWRSDPKRVCRLQEHHYGEDIPPADVLTGRVRTCIESFYRLHLTRVAAIQLERIVKIEPLEAFAFEGVKVYAVPDLAYLDADQVLHVEDWKTGKRTLEHRDQVALYALWARERFGLSVALQARLQYLLDGRTVEVVVTDDLLDGARSRLRAAITEVKRRLDGEDLVRNITVEERWELTGDLGECSRCAFRLVCSGAKRLVAPAEVA